MEINFITIIGANGTVGSQVAGLLAAFCNAKVYLVSRSIEKSIAALEQAVKSVRADSIRSLLIPVTYEELPDCISQSQWIFESIAENLTLKQDIHRKIYQYRKPGTLVSSGTSGLSIEELASVYNEEGRSLFFGTHFFNPPYSLPLMEFTRTKWTNTQVAEDFASYLGKTVLRKVVRTKDKPAFLGNRIGFLFLNETVQFAEIYKDRGGIDYIDSILGPFSGRSMAPLNTIDFVGLDIHEAIMENLIASDPNFFSKEQQLPNYVFRLVQDGRLGRKSGAGFYKVEFLPDGEKNKLVYDINSDSYRPIKKYRLPFADSMVTLLSDGLYKEAVSSLLQDTSEEAAICRYFLVKYVLCSYLSAFSVAETIADADIAMSYGFGWVPPSSLCALLGGREGIERIIAHDIRLKESMGTKDCSLLEHVPLKTGIDYRRYFKAAR